MGTIKITPHLTHGPADNLAARTAEGQASWANNWKHNCEGCDFYRPMPKKKQHGHCAKYTQLQGRQGKDFPGLSVACRFWTPKPDTTSATGTKAVR